MLIDIESLMDVLFCFAYNEMGLLFTVLKPINTPLYRFSGHSIGLHEGVELLLILGSYPTQATIVSNFLIVDTYGVYNTIIRRSTLNAL